MIMLNEDCCTFPRRVFWPEKNNEQGARCRECQSIPARSIMVFSHFLYSLDEHVVIIIIEMLSVNVPEYRYGISIELLK